MDMSTRVRRVTSFPKGTHLGGHTSNARTIDFWDERNIYYRPILAKMCFNSGLGFFFGYKSRSTGGAEILLLKRLVNGSLYG